jgi:hypothetical protein
MEDCFLFPKVDVNEVFPKAKMAKFDLDKICIAAGNRLLN